MKRKQTNYEADFKLTVVNEVLKKGIKQAEVANCYGIRNQLVSRWVQQYKDRTSWARNAEQVDSDKRLLRLQKENKQLKMENEILKKASAYFAKNL